MKDLNYIRCAETIDRIGVKRFALHYIASHHNKRTLPIARKISMVRKAIMYGEAESAKMHGVSRQRVDQICDELYEFGMSIINRLNDKELQE